MPLESRSSLAEESDISSNSAPRYEAAQEERTVEETKGEEESGIIENPHSG
jgi:hypothetical protein